MCGSGSIKSIGRAKPTQPQARRSIMHKVIIDKAEGVSYGKIKAVNQGEGMKEHAILYMWSTGVSGMGLAEQARRLMHPESVRRDWDLSAAIDS